MKNNCKHCKGSGATLHVFRESKRKVLVYPADKTYRNRAKTPVRVSYSTCICANNKWVGMSVMLESGWSFKANGGFKMYMHNLVAVVKEKDRHKRANRLYYGPVVFDFSATAKVSMQEVADMIRKAIHKKSNYTLKCK